MDVNAPDETPDWTAIEQDPIRAEHEVPWLMREMQRATEFGLHNMDPGREYWLGFRDALREAIERPRQEIEEAAKALAASVASEREKENARRERFGPARLRRLIPIERWGRIQSEPGATAR